MSFTRHTEGRRYAELPRLGTHEAQQIKKRIRVRSHLLPATNPETFSLKFYPRSEKILPWGRCPTFPFFSFFIIPQKLSWRRCFETEPKLLRMKRVRACDSDPPITTVLGKCWLQHFMWLIWYPHRPLVRFDIGRNQVCVNKTANIQP